MQRLSRNLLLFAAFFAFLGAAAAIGPIRSFEQLKELIEKKGVRSVEELLPLLDDELRAHFTVTFLGRSPQAGTLEKPRITLHSKDGSMFISFNADPSQHGGNAVEVLSLDKKTMLYSLNKVSFDPGSGPKYADHDELKVCVRCHASTKDFEQGLLEAHPILDSYSEVHHGFGASELHGEDVKTSHARTAKKLRDALASLQKQAADGHPRYQHLIGLSDLSYEQLANRDAELGDTVARNALNKVARLVRVHPQYETYAPAFQHLDDSDVEFAKMLPDNFAEEYLQQSAALRAEVQERQARFFKEKVKRYAELTGNQAEEATLESEMLKHPNVDYLVNADAEKTTQYAREKFLLEKMGLSPELLNLTVEKRSYSMSQRGVNLGHLREHIRAYEQAHGPGGACYEPFEKLVTP